jgi:hypothetical protein
MNRFVSSSTAAAAMCAALWIVDNAKSQIPVKIPTGDQERLVNLELRVSHLEQALAKTQQQLAALRPADGSDGVNTVPAPFSVVNSSGKPIFTVEDDDGAEVTLRNGNGAKSVRISSLKIQLQSADASQYVGLLMDSGGHPFVTVRDTELASIGVDGKTKAMGVRLGGAGGKLASLDLERDVGNIQLYKDSTPVARISSETGFGGPGLVLKTASGSGSFIATVSTDRGGYATATSTTDDSFTVGASASGQMGARLYSGNGAVPIGGLVKEQDGTGMLYVGSGKGILAQVGVNAEGSGVIDVMRDDKQVLAYLVSNSNGGEIGVSNSSGQRVAILDTNPGTNGGRATFTDSGGTPAAKVGAMGANQGDLCIVRGDKPGKCLSQTVLPLSIGQ